MVSGASTNVYKQNHYEAIQIKCFVSHCLTGQSFHFFLKSKKKNLSFTSLRSKYFKVLL